MSFLSFIEAQIKLAPFLGSATIIRSNAQLRLPPKAVILTFDDGPNSENSTTERLLSTLKKHNIKAHFSLIGKNMDTVIRRNIDGIIYQNGGIIVLHDGKVFRNKDSRPKYNRSWIPDATESIICILQSWGFYFMRFVDIV
ncbi:MAG: polysaccharide deacetylase family protein [Chitinivibrionales bacterium]|nr:polysaccharide deacetylase family protein [Chitinivibrionales bacterium]